MLATMTQAGAHMVIDSRLPALDRLITEACGPALQPGSTDDPDVQLQVSDDGRPFSLEGWHPLTRNAYHRDGNVLLLDACGSGFDLRLTVRPGTAWARLCVEARYRPSARTRFAAQLLPARFHLLARDALLLYPALWVAGTRGRTPLHAAAVTIGDRTALLAGPGGVGRSTLLLEAVASGAVACADNLCVSDGQVVHGVVEPVRITGAGGRRMPHGRRECDLPGRVGSLVPDCVVVMQRSRDGAAHARPISARRAAMIVTAGTYMAGELSRYWAFASTLSLGTGRGPVHPPIASTADLLTRLRCVEIVLGRRPSPTLAELLESAAVQSASPRPAQVAFP